MLKIPSLFEKDSQSKRSLAIRKITRGCEWVFTDQNIKPTRQYDGVPVLLDDRGRWWAPREIATGLEKPQNFKPVKVNAETGNTIGWESIENSAYARFHHEAIKNPSNATRRWPIGTYELCGPKIEKNMEGFHQYTLIPHSQAEELRNLTVTFDGIYEYLDRVDIEGIVFHHPDGRMCKVKASDYGIKRRPR